MTFSSKYVPRRVHFTLTMTLRQSYRETSRASHKEAVLLALALSQCYHGLKNNSNEESMLRDLFDTLITGESIESGLITVCTELAAFYERASPICLAFMSR